jgi:hypothetical protein
MLTHPVTDPRAWRATTIDPPSSWYYPLPEAFQAALDETLRRMRGYPRPIMELCAGEEPCAAHAELLQPMRTALESGRGFVVIRIPQPERYEPGEMQVCSWLIGQLLGQPVAQDVQNTLLYDVRDTGQDVRYGARFSVTNAESTFHTDNSFGATIVDYVGLLCLQSARQGG